jgi:hypothetical protein
MDHQSSADPEGPQRPSDQALSAPGVETLERGIEVELLDRLVLRLIEDLEVLAEGDVRCLERRAFQCLGQAESLGRVALAFHFTLDRMGVCWPALLALSWSDAAQIGVALEHGGAAEQAAARASSAPDVDGKRRLMDLGSHLAASLEAGLGEVGQGDLLVRFEACQGVRPETCLGLGESTAAAEETSQASSDSGGRADPGDVTTTAAGPGRGAAGEGLWPWLGAQLELCLAGQEAGPALLLVPRAALT